jgi:hypothetical protein
VISNSTQQLYNSSLCSSFCICWWQFARLQIERKLLLQNRTIGCSKCLFVLAIESSLLQNGRIGCSYLCLQLRQVCSKMGELGVLICACKLRQVHSKGGQLGSVLVCACRLTQVCCIIRQLGVDGSCQMAQQQTTGRERHAHTQPHVHVEWASRRATNERGCIPYACLGCKRWFAQISAFLNPKPSMCKTKL